MHYVLHEVK